MKPVDTDPFPRAIEIRRGRRRTVEIALENGRFVARVPARAQGPSLEAMLTRLRAQLWARLRSENVYDEPSLRTRAAHVAARFLGDLDLPPWSVHFSRRQHRRWGSCTFDGSSGRIRISAHLLGHPNWVVDAVLLHELIHLLVLDHGPRFQELLARDPLRDRALGYLEALENLDRVGPMVSEELVASIEDEIEAIAPRPYDGARRGGGRRVQLGLFGGD